MPGGFPLGMEFSGATDVGTVLGNSAGTALTPNATANTKGSYTQLVASTAADTSWIDVAISTGTGVGGFGVDIAVGGAGSEQVILNNLVFEAVAALFETEHFSFPICIPSGTRISARAQSNTASDGTVLVSALLFYGALDMIDGCAGVDAVGFSTATSQGTQVDPGAVANTKGTYAQLTASTAADYIGFVIGFDNQNGGGTNNSHSLIDVAIGGAGSEQVIVPNYTQRRVVSGGYCVVCTSPPIYVSIPKGTRVAARAQASDTTANDRVVGVTVYGIYQ